MAYAGNGADDEGKELETHQLGDVLAGLGDRRHQVVHVAHRRILGAGERVGGCVGTHSMQSPFDPFRYPVGPPPTFPPPPVSRHGTTYLDQNLEGEQAIENKVDHKG